MSDVPRRLPPRRHVPLTENDEQSDTIRSSYHVTLNDVSQQVAALSSQLHAVHSQVTLTRSELGALSKFVMGDLAGRVTGVEAKTGIVPAGVKRAGKYSALVLAIPVLLQIVAEFKPTLVGPIQQLIQLFQ